MAEPSDIRSNGCFGQTRCRNMDAICRYFINSKFYSKNRGRQYVLARNLHHVDFWQFYLTLPWPLPQPQDFELIYTKMIIGRGH
jgi:hypothetical protein